MFSNDLRESNSRPQLFIFTWEKQERYQWKNDLKIETNQTKLTNTKNSCSQKEDEKWVHEVDS